MRLLIGVLIGCLIMYALQTNELLPGILAVCCVIGVTTYIAR